MRVRCRSSNAPAGQTLTLHQVCIPIRPITGPSQPRVQMQYTIAMGHGPWVPDRFCSTAPPLVMRGPSRGQR